jgi:cyclopropane fatty-acyl-phospholipid synthase-like methyltransferase
MDAESFGTRYDALLKAPRMRALYGDSGYFNIGYWEAGTTDLVAACDRLVDELASIVPDDARFILDIGCGIGGGTRRLTDRFPDALVLGANISHWQLAQARQRGVAVAVMDAVHLPIASGSVDAVIAAESAQCFDTRADFFAEAYRVLRPGGTLSVADMLFRDTGPSGSWMIPAANHIDTLDQYGALITAAGFELGSVRDTVGSCWKPYCAAMRGVFPGHEFRVDEIEASLAFYALAFATKP